jgi:hypothetical protein
VNIDINERGRADVAGNELMVDSTIDDPPKQRLASPGRGSYGCLSGNRLRDDGGQDEKVLLILKPDEDAGGDGGCYDFFAQKPGTVDDKNMIRVARLTTRGFELFVPLVQHAVVGDPAPPQPPPPAPSPTPQPSDPTHGIPPGAFLEVLRIYGFASDDEQPYYENRMTWETVIQRMDERDDFHKFPHS